MYNMFDIILRYIPFYIAVAWGIIVFLSGTYSVAITELKVPPFLKNGTGKPTILDCQYSLRQDEIGPNSGLVVKWFLSKSPNPVYQWILNQKPQGFGVLKGRLWLDYKASDSNLTVHRALYILNPTVELSGDYKCTVSTNVDEDFAIKKMIVFAPEKKMEMTHSRSDLETINVTCRAYDIFPKPEMFIYNDTAKFKEVVVLPTAERTNAYDMLAYVLIPDTELTSPTTIDCEIKITNTPYNNKKTLQYYPGNTESLSSISDCGVSIGGSILDVFVPMLASYLILNIRF